MAVDCMSCHASSYDQVYIDADSPAGVDDPIPRCLTDQDAVLQTGSFRADLWFAGNQHLVEALGWAHSLDAPDHEVRVVRVRRPASEGAGIDCPYDDTPTPAVAVVLIAGREGAAQHLDEHRQRVAFVAAEWEEHSTVVEVVRIDGRAAFLVEDAPGWKIRAFGAVDAELPFGDDCGCEIDDDVGGVASR